jgi:Zn-dependent peptidase ImmA (M78 family)/transcriptional regulator with XRE-family HTH domain
MPFERTRLSLARRRAGLSVSALARELGISAQSIHNYEAGRQSPSPGTLTSLARVLGFPTVFFQMDASEPLIPEQVTFRARSKMTAGSRDSALADAELAVLLRKHIESAYTRLPRVDVPTPEGPVEPEIAAEYVRARWGVDPHTPAPNMVHLLELKGVAVFSLPSMDQTLDAFAFWRNERPFVMLSMAKTAERSRFDAAHELGHLVLHASGYPSNDPEREANAFASAFLMPSLGVRRRVKPNTNTAQILHEKAYWKTAAMALTYRLHALGLLSDWSYRNNILALGRQGYRSAEPKGIERERSLLFQKVFGGDSGATNLRQAVSKVGMREGMLGQLTFESRPAVARLREVDFLEQPSEAGPPRLRAVK